MVNENGSPIQVFRWNEVFLRRFDNASYPKFTNKFIRISYTIERKIEGNDILIVILYVDDLLYMVSS